MNTWKKEAYYLLEKIGGEAYLQDIYDAFLTYHTRPMVVSYRECLRDALERGCVESVKFDGEELFYCVEGKHNGHRGIVK